MEKVKRVLVGCVAILLLTGAALADIPGPPLHYTDGSNLYTYNWAAASGTKLCTFSGAVNSDVWDIAWDVGGALYGVNTSGGRFIQIDPVTGVTTLRAITFSGIDIASDVTALANYGSGLFYAAVDGGADATKGHFYDWQWNGVVLTGSDRGAMHDDVGAADNVADDLLLNPETKPMIVTSTGDLWVDASANKVYATVNVYYGGGANVNLRWFLVTIDPVTAEMDYVANLSSISDNDKQFFALSGRSVGATNNLVLMRQDGKLYEWDGTNIIDPVLNVGGGITHLKGGTGASVPVPVPAALPLGILGLAGLTVLGRKMRKLA